VASEGLCGGLIADGDEGGGAEESPAGIFAGVDIEGVDADAVADTEVLSDIGGEERG